MRTLVETRPYSDGEIERSIEDGTPFDKAGGYAIQDPDFHPVGSFRGCYCNVVGLPLWTLHAMLLEVGLTQDIRTPEADRPICATCSCRDEGMPTRVEIGLPADALVVLCGPAGSGKSSFAREHFRATQVVSTDALRAMVSDDEADQGASGAAFSLLRIILKHRLERRLLTVVDSTAVEAAHRRLLIRIAAAHQVPSVGIFFASGLRLACHATTCAGVASILKSLPVNMSSFGRRCSAHSARDGAGFSCFHRTGRRLWTLDRRGDQRLAVADPSETSLNREPVRAAPRLPAAGRLDQKPRAAAGTADDSDARAHRQ